ncbi:MAG: alpha/beta fold hydrolase, partial [Candidatus Dormibacteria bacterium]
MLVLLHGIGMGASAWTPVIDRLSGSRRVIAFDLPGFGQTPALPDGMVPSAENLAEALAAELRQRQVELPVDVAGNSLGGRIALEFARQGHARSVVALSPAGLWKERAPAWIGLVLWVTYVVCRRAPRLTWRSLGTPLGRTLGMLVTVAWKGWRIPASVARQSAIGYATSTAFMATLAAGAPPFRRGDEV